MRCLVFLLFAGLPALAAFRYDTTSDWGSGFCGQIKVTNDSSSTISNWTLEFDFDRGFTSFWNGQVTNHAGNHYTVKSAGWNDQIAPGGWVDVGFCGSPGNITTSPLNYRLSGTGVVPPPTPTPTPTPTPPPPVNGIKVTLRSTSQWSGGYTGDLVIQNGSQPVNGWRLAFTVNSTIQSLWNGILSQQGNTYNVVNESWNGAFAIGASVQLGFTAAGTLTTAGNCIFNGAACTISIEAPVIPPGSGAITIDGIDTSTAVDQFSIRPGTLAYALRASGVTTPVFKVTANNPRAVSAVVTGTTLQVTGLAPGRSGLRIEETSTHLVRHVGVRVLNPDGSPPAMPRYLSVGSVSEDTSAHLSFWRGFETGNKNRYADVRYIYLNGGPFQGWNTWGDVNGSRLVSYIRNSKQLGMIPYFVWYNIPEGSESYFTELQNVQNAAYMRGYFMNLKFALDLIRQESPDDLVGMIIEPDFIGYLAQNAGKPASAIAASTRGAYDSGVLQPGVDPQFPDTVKGLVQAINYTIRKYTPQVWFGWQVNLWASPASGWTTPIPGKGLIQKTLSSGITTGRLLIAQEATAIANDYMEAGIASNGAKFVSIDKYGLDATGYELGAATDPASSTWFWNHDLWGNYLIFARSLRLATNLPVVLWQLPAGHINSSRETNPYDPLGLFPDLTNTTNRYEDSAPSYLFGDTFVTTGRRLEWFSANLGADPGLRTSGNTVTWNQHMTDAAASGVLTVLFGPGVGISTTNIGINPGDNLWWITKAQKYLAAPVPIP